jgi:hypothetical protein
MDGEVIADAGSWRAGTVGTLHVYVSVLVDGGAGGGSGGALLDGTGAATAASATAVAATTASAATSVVAAVVRLIVVVIALAAIIMVAAETSQQVGLRLFFFYGGLSSSASLDVVDRLEDVLDVILRGRGTGGVAITEAAATTLVAVAIAAGARVNLITAKVTAPRAAIEAAETSAFVAALTAVDGVTTEGVINLLALHNNSLGVDVVVAGAVQLTTRLLDPVDNGVVDSFRMDRLDVLLNNGLDDVLDRLDDVHRLNILRLIDNRLIHLGGAGANNVSLGGASADAGSGRAAALANDVGLGGASTSRGSDGAAALALADAAVGAAVQAGHSCGGGGRGDGRRV